MGSWSVADVPDQSGRVAIVTGSNSGLGLETARVLAGRGATVVLACRNVAKAEQAASAIRHSCVDAQLQVRHLDLADLAAVEEFATDFISDHDRLDLLINNAGLMAVDESQTTDGFETQFGVNHLGHYALTRRLLPLLRSLPGSRVANMSSIGHWMGTMRVSDLTADSGYQRWPAYFRSKLANLLFTAELQRRLASADATTIAVAAHPGGSRTDLGSEGRSVTNAATRAVWPFITQSAAAGALPMLRAATDPGVLGGQYYGPRFFALGGGAVLEEPSSSARDPVAAEQLWLESAKSVGMSPDI